MTVTITAKFFGHFFFGCGGGSRSCMRSDAIVDELVEFTGDVLVVLEQCCSVVSRGW